MYQSNLMDNSPTAGSNNPVISSGIKSYADSAYTLPTATSSRLGGVKKGSNLTVSSDGTINYTLPAANVNNLGGVIVNGDLGIKTDSQNRLRFNLPKIGWANIRYTGSAVTIPAQSSTTLTDFILITESGSMNDFDRYMTKGGVPITLLNSNLGGIGIPITFTPNSANDITLWVEYYNIKSSSITISTNAYFNLVLVYWGYELAT